MKRFINFIVILFILYIVLAFFGPKHLHVEKTISIKQSPELLKAELNSFKNFHEHWSPFTEKDSAMKVEYTGEPGTVGSKYKWSGNAEVDEGTIEYLGWSGDTLKEKITFGGQGDANLSFVLTVDSAGCSVTWGIDIAIAFMRRPFMLFIPMEKFLGEDFSKGLAKLKKYAEAQASPKTYSIETINLPAINYIGIKETVMFADMAGFYERAYAELFSDKSIVPLSAPSSVFLSYDAVAGKAEILACVAIEKKLNQSKFTQIVYPASSACVINFYGAYNKVGPAHDQLARYVQEKKLSTIAVVEEYITDPALEKDSTKWLTKIIYRCK